MKKITCLLFSILFLMIFIPNVYATSVRTYVNGPSSIYPNNDIKISVGVSSAPLLYGFTGKINYDTSKLKLDKSSGLSGFSILLGQNLTADSATGKSGSFSFLELVFIPTNNFKPGEKTTISFTDVETSDGENTLSGINSSLSITMNAPKSQNNYLSNLKIDKGNIDFNKNKDMYSLVVENDVTKVVIDATAEDNRSKITGIGTKTLNVYENIFKIIVTSESDSKKTYTIVITRKDEEGKTSKPKVEKEPEKEKPVLDDLKIDGYDFNFKKDVYNYSIELKKGDTQLNIIPNYDKSKFIYEVDIPKEYIVGENLVKITLKDNDGNKTEYSIIVFKKEEIKEDVTNQEECKCVPSSCHYKSLFYLENIFLFITIVTFFLIRKKLKK